MKKILLCFLLSCVLFKPAQAGYIYEYTDDWSFDINFEVNSSAYDQEYKGGEGWVKNEDVMSAIQKICKEKEKDIQQIVLVGAASETGLQKNNDKLAVDRVKAVENEIRKICSNEIWVKEHSTGGSDFDIMEGYSEVRDEAASKRAVYIYIQMKHVSEICKDDKIKGLWSGGSTVEGLAGVKKLKDACEKGLTNEKIIGILKELAGAPGIPNEVTEIVGVYEILYNIEKDVSAWNLKTSVWKNKEGKFNTARLVSDATAGVVLGTVGSIITSKIIKKNQVKQGFEDLRCVIGGQDVANWGDEFRVGIVTDLK